MIEIAIPLVIAYFLLSGKKDPAKKTDIPNPPPSPENYNPIEDRFDETIKKFADGYGIPWQIIKAHLAVESNFGTTPDVVERKLGGGNKRGIMGITEATFKSINTMIKGNWVPDDLWKPEVSIECAAALIKSNTIAITKDKDFFIKDYSNMTDAALRTKQEDFARIIMSYNAGVGAVKAGTFTQRTKDYLNQWSAAFQKINDKLKSAS